MKKSSIYKIATVLTAMYLNPAAVSGQSLRILDIAHGTSEANIKAEITRAEGKSVTKVIGRTFHMPTGNSTISESFRIIGDRYVVANLDYHDGADYFYRLEVTFDDGTEIKTDCYNADYTEGAVWLSDLPVASKVAANIEVGIDECVTGKPLQIHPTTTFAKGISLYNPGEVTFNVARQNEHGVPFEYSKFTIGLQAYKPDGSASSGFCRLVFKMNGAETGSKGNMKAYSNSTRGSAVYYFDQTQANANGINTIGFQVLNANGTVASSDNVGNLAACRLYYTVPPQSGAPQTITFDHPGGAIHESDPEVRLGAYATGLTPIYYSIVQGADLATLENNVLKPHHGKSGTIVVEAFTPGDENHAPASVTQTYTFNFGPTVKYLYTHRHPEDPAQQVVYLYIDTQDKSLEKLALDIYDDARSFMLVQSIGILDAGLDAYATAIPNVYAIPFNSTSASMAVNQLKYKFAGEEEQESPLTEGDESFLYMTDIPGIVTSSAYEVYIDTAFSGGRLGNAQYNYSKGYGIHASNGSRLSTMETPASFSLAPFYRFAVDVSGQKDKYGNMVSFQLYNGITTPYLNTGNVNPQNVYEWDFMLQSTGSGKTLKIAVGNGGDGYGQDVTCIGAPRFYYTRVDAVPQTISWDSEQYINNYRAFTVPLTATASSGLPILYRISSGAEYATIVDNSILSITDLPDESADIVVEAIQPGDKMYAHSDAAYCTFKLSRSVIVRRDERMAIDGGNTINELLIYADAHSAGQVEVKSGVVNVERLVLKYTFTPGEWTFISFPSNFNLAEISNLSSKGYTYAVEEGSPKTFLLREYHSQTRSENHDDTAWISPRTPDVAGSKGYIMKLEDDSNQPVEITFEMNNVALNFENTSRDLFLSLDLTQTEPESRHTVYLRPSNVKGNTLRVDVRFTPTDLSLLPVNHAKALEAMRVTHSPVRGAIRLTLPEQTPARVAIFDKKGKHLLKAVNYVSPMKIDISDLKPDTYRMVVVYGPASRELLVEL